MRCIESAWGRLPGEGGMGWDKVQLPTPDTRCHSIIGGYVAWALPPHIMDGDNEGSQVGEHRYSVEGSYLKIAVRTTSK